MSERNPVTEDGAAELVGLAAQISSNLRRARGEVQNQWQEARSPEAKRQAEEKLKQLDEALRRVAERIRPGPGGRLRLDDRYEATPALRKVRDASSSGADWKTQLQRATSLALHVQQWEQEMSLDRLFAESDRERAQAEERQKWARARLERNCGIPPEVPQLRPFAAAMDQLQALMEDLEDPECPPEARQQARELNRMLSTPRESYS